MRPTIVATGTRKKQIDRPYGESITSLDAYIKLKEKENNSRKRKSSKDNNGTNEKPKSKQTKG